MKIRNTYYILAIILFLTDSCKNNNYKSGNGIQETIKIDSIYTPIIGGIKQAIKIQTDDLNKPTLLYFCGGPGGSEMDVSHSFTDILKEKFTLIEWDARNAGKTLKLNISPVEPTIEIMTQDGLEVVEFVLKELKKDKTHLVATSFGNILGLNIVKSNPELIKSYFAVNSVINQKESDKRLLEFLKIHYHDNEIATNELKHIQIPFESEEDLFVLWKWLFIKDGNKYVTTENYKNGFLKWSNEWKNVINEMYDVDFTKTLTEVDCPIYFFVGKNDYQTSTEVAKDYFKNLNASKKRLIVFENSGHGIHSDESIKFQETIIGLVNTENDSE